MAFDFEALKKNLQKSTEILQKTVTEASGKLAESVKEVQTNKTVKDIVQKSQSAFTTLKTKGEEVLTQQREKNDQYKEAVLEITQHQSDQERILSVRDSLRLIYCLMIVDGTVSNEEQISFYDIGRELDPEFESYQGLLIEEGSHLLHMPSENEDEYYDNIPNHVSDIIYSASIPKENGIRGKVLLWNLLTVAFSEGEYTANEKRLLRYITKCVNVDYAVFLEMEHATRTLMAIRNEENWLKSTNRGQTIIDERLKELLDRKETIMIEVNELFSD